MSSPTEKFRDRDASLDIILHGEQDVSQRAIWQSLGIAALLVASFVWGHQVGMETPVDRGEQSYAAAALQRLNYPSSMIQSTAYSSGGCLFEQRADSLITLTETENSAFLMQRAVDLMHGGLGFLGDNLPPIGMGRLDAIGDRGILLSMDGTRVQTFPRNALTQLPDDVRLMQVVSELNGRATMVDFAPAFLPDGNGNTTSVRIIRDGKPEVLPLQDYVTQMSDRVASCRY